MSEIDIEGAGIWQFPHGMFKNDGNVFRPVLDVPRFKLPSGFAPRYREMFHESPLFTPRRTNSLPIAPLPVVNRYMFPYEPASNTGATPTQDKCYFAPMPLHFTSISFDRIGVLQAANGTATAVLRLGAYKNDGTDANPSTLIVDGGTVTADAGGSVAKTVTVAITVTRGWFWSAACPQVAGPAQYAMITPLIYADAGHDSGPTFVRSQPQATGITGAFANAPTITLLGNVTQPMVGLRISGYAP